MLTRCFTDCLTPTGSKIIDLVTNYCLCQRVKPFGTEPAMFSTEHAYVASVPSCISNMTLNGCILMCDKSVITSVFFRRESMINVSAPHPHTVIRTCLLCALNLARSLHLFSCLFVFTASFIFFSVLRLRSCPTRRCRTSTRCGLIGTCKL